MSALDQAQRDVIGSGAKRDPKSGFDSVVHVYSNSRAT
ncbi:MAG: hypothetical protein ACI9MC_003543 [Kiritimatiellia bacterium]